MDTTPALRTGTPVILLPGGVLPADLAYRALLGHLGDGVAAVTKDLELYAGDEPPPGYGLDDEIEGVRRTARQAAFDRFHLVGYSGGGAVALAFTARHPERVRSLVLMEPAWAGRTLQTPAERDWHDQDTLTGLPDDAMMSAFVRMQLRPGVVPPARPHGPAPDWMAKRPAGLRALLAAFRSTDLDVGRLRAFDRPVRYVLGGLSAPDYYAAQAELLKGVFGDFTVDTYPERHHFDPPHRAEPARLAATLRAQWARADTQPGAQAATQG